VSNFGQIVVSPFDNLPGALMGIRPVAQTLAVVMETTETRDASRH